MQRILDLDRDFILSDAAMLHGPDDGRLDGADFPPWPLEQVLAFLHGHRSAAGGASATNAAAASSETAL
jgi:hypothetical protein